MALGGGFSVGKFMRKAISKKLRFEVFKRDSFTCQYCGAKAPDVILHVDHIKPVAGGGGNEIMNLVTACVSCNQGKGKRKLSDNATVEKSRQQAKLMQERREQIEMMRDWQLALVDNTNMEVQAVDDLVDKLTSGEKRISDSYKPEVVKLIKKHGLQKVLECLRVGVESYGDVNTALGKLGGICHCHGNDYYRKRAYICTIFNNKVKNFNYKDFLMVCNQCNSDFGKFFIVGLEKIARVAPEGIQWVELRQFIEMYADRIAYRACIAEEELTEKPNG